MVKHFHSLYTHRSMDTTSVFCSSSSPHPYNIYNLIIMHFHFHIIIIIYTFRIKIFPITTIPKIKFHPISNGKSIWFAVFGSILSSNNVPQNAYTSSFNARIFMAFLLNLSCLLYRTYALLNEYANTEALRLGTEEIDLVVLALFF